MKKRKRFWMILACAVVGTVAILVLLLRDAPIPVLRINTVSIGEEEFRLFQAQNRAAVIGMLQRDYGVEYEAGYWKKEVNGKKTAAYLQEAVQQKLVQVSVTEELLRKENLLPYDDFRELKQLWEQTNAARKKAVEAHQVIYGPIEYELEEFREYILANALIAWENQLLQTDGAAVAIEDLAALRQMHPEMMPQQTPNVTVAVWWGEDAQQEAEALAAAWKEGQDVPSAWTDKFRQENLVCSEENKLECLRRCPALWEQVMQAKEGEIIGPLCENGKTVVGQVISVVQEEEPIEAQIDWYLHKYFELQIQQKIADGISNARVFYFRPCPNPQG